MSLVSLYVRNYAPYFASLCCDEFGQNRKAVMCFTNSHETERLMQWWLLYSFNSDIHGQDIGGYEWNCATEGKLGEYMIKRYLARASHGKLHTHSNSNI